VGFGEKSWGPKFFSIMTSFRCWRSVTKLVLKCSEDPVSYMRLRGSKPPSATEKKLFGKNVFLRQF